MSLNLDDIPTLVGQMEPAAIDRLLLELAATEEIEIIRTPRSGLVMMTCRDAFDCDFHLGEVLVSEAEVCCRGVHGYGMVPGDDPRRALARAVAEVIIAGDNQLLRQRLNRLAAEQRHLLEQQQRDAAELVARTKVRFDLMPGS
ncbi:hypothetical protein JCM30471_21320 [Desulfuromonas carbonis]|uniref:phosphonate C-P lyase system protein PhnG n=1 Tax=Desulfuromonas sp. DDH964 TaxID=1823759 RepID=UPI00078E656C|nr:phosphonate C-P lyase system protein PhnG [Desulfuromonas sp. DDH964]AMV73713.1 hypothetical protein DBW_3415 [Desulfuromonas sp. DDH964]